MWGSLDAFVITYWIYFLVGIWTQVWVSHYFLQHVYEANFILFILWSQTFNHPHFHACIQLNNMYILGVYTHLPFKIDFRQSASTLHFQIKTKENQFWPICNDLFQCFLFKESSHNNIDLFIFSTFQENL